MPFWPARAGIPATYPRLDGDAQCEVAVLGGGVTGALAAHALIQRGHDVLVLEASDVAAGSTAASSGLLLYETDASLETLADEIGPSSAVRVYRLGLDAIAQIEALQSAIGVPCGFARRPALYVASTRRHVPALRREFEARRDGGFDVEFLSASEIGARYALRAPAAILSRGCAEIDAYRFTHAVVAAAHRGGARVFARTTVKRLRQDRRGFVLETTAGFRVGARKVINAGGYAGAERVGRTTGRLASSWAVVTEPLRTFPGWPDRCLIWETARPYFYARTTDDGRVLAGGGDEPSAARQARPRVLARKTQELLTRTRRMFPDLEIRPDFSWAATFATTDDSLPFIGPSRRAPNLIHVLGYGGNGITFSMIGAGIAADIIAGRPRPDGGLFDLTRS